VFYIVITTCMISWWNLADSQPFCSIIHSQPSCRWIIQHSSSYLFQFKIFNIYAHTWCLGSWLTCIAHSGSSKRSCFLKPSCLQAELYQPSANELVWEGFSMACRQVWPAVVLQKTKYAIYILGPNTHKCTPSPSPHVPSSYIGANLSWLMWKFKD
jgi:hypothetical protein